MRNWQECEKQGYRVISAFDWAELPKPIRNYIRTADLLDGI
jgi:hypothetical protein